MKKRVEEIELIEGGFQINSNKEVIQFKWSEIEKVIAFKIDRLITDDICLKIESNAKISYVTEEFNGWRIFMDKLLDEFLEIDRNWEEIIAIPAFETNEMELYFKSK